MDDGALAIDGLENHEMVQVPVQDGGKLDFSQGGKLYPQGPGGEIQAVGEPHQAAQGRPGEGQGEPLAQAVQVDIMPMVARDHGHAGQATLGRLGALDHGKPSPARKVEFRQAAHFRRPAA